MKAVIRLFMLAGGLLIGGVACESVVDFGWQPTNTAGCALALYLMSLAIYLGRVQRRAIHDALRRRSMCVGCSYDLTGNTSGVCPECGTKIAR